MPNAFSVFKRTSHNHSSIYLGLGLLTLMVLSLVIVSLSLPESQDIRQQAASCSENPVNVQFRLSGSQDTPWRPGESFQPSVGDLIDVNCFAQNGSALLSNGLLDGFLDGVLVLDGRPTEIRNLTISSPGTYKFVCSNGAGCYDADNFVVIDPNANRRSPSPEPSPSPVVDPTPSPVPTASPVPGVCPESFVSDLNNDCQVDVQDYTVFLEDFRQNVSAQ